MIADGVRLVLIGPCGSPRLVIPPHSQVEALGSLVVSAVIVGAGEGDCNTAAHPGCRWHRPSLLAAGCSIGWHAASVLFEGGLWTPVSPPVLVELLPATAPDALPALVHEHAHVHAPSSSSSSPAGHAHAHSHDLALSTAELFGPAAGIGVCLATVGAKMGLYWWTLRVAAEQRSQVLLANAWHHVSDSMTSVVAALGIAGAEGGGTAALAHRPRPTPPARRAFPSACRRVGGRASARPLRCPLRCGRSHAGAQGWNASGAPLRAPTPPPLPPPASFRRWARVSAGGPSASWPTRRWMLRRSRRRGWRRWRCREWRRCAA